MDMKKVRYIVLAATWSLHAIAGGCPELDNETRDQVLRLARFQHNLGEAVRLTIEGEPLPDCFYQVRLRSAPPNEGFVKTFTITPDHKYAVSEAVDLRKDPAQEARKRNKAFAAQLAPPTAPVRGHQDAPVSIVIFSDFQCPFCRLAANVLTAEWARANPDARVVFRHFPLPMHGWARPAAEASVCAARQKDEFFWTAHDFLFQHQGQLSRANLIGELETELQKNSDFDKLAFRQCIESGAAKEAVQADIDFGLENKVDATPTVFVNGSKVNWAANPDQVRSLVRQAAKAAAANSAGLPNTF